MMMKKWLIVVIVLLTASFMAACSTASVATVNGDKVTAADFNYYWQNLSRIYEANEESLDDSMKATVVDQLVYYKLLEQAVADLDCLPDDDEVQAYFEEKLAEIYGSYEEGLEEVQSYGLDQDFFFDQYRYALYEERIKGVLSEEQGVSVSEAEAQEIYDADPESYNTRRVSHILIKPYAVDGGEIETDADGNPVYTEAQWQAAKTKANEIIAQLEAGGDFAKLAIKYSDDTATAGAGGVIDATLTADNTDLEASFVKAVFTLEKAGDYTTTPVKTSYGYHLIYCDEALSPNNIEDVLAYIMKDQIQLKQQQLLTTYIEEQKDAAEISYHLDVIK